MIICAKQQASRVSDGSAGFCHEASAAAIEGDKTLALDVVSRLKRLSRTQGPRLGLARLRA
jgi:hypothetical protein